MLHLYMEGLAMPSHLSIPRLGLHMNLEWSAAFLKEGGKQSYDPNFQHRVIHRGLGMSLAYINVLLTGF